MKKIYLVCYAIMLACNAFAQSPDTSTTQKLLQYILAPVDKSQIPTGFLEEYGCPILPMTTFNGALSDSNKIDKHIWRTLYFQLQTSWCQSSANPLPTIVDVNSNIRNNLSDTLPTPIPILIGQYNSVIDNAFNDNLLSYNTSTRQVSDVSGRTESPYQQETVFAASPEISISQHGKETFIIPADLIWNNTGNTIDQIQIDFQNGDGLQTLSVGTPFTVNYTDTGSKSWTIKVLLNNNTTLQCHSDYYVLDTPDAIVNNRYITPTTPSWGYISPITGVHAGGRISIVYSSKNRTNTLRKPLIIVEGYDVSRVAPSIQRDYTIRDAINALNEPLAEGYDFNDALDATAGYDLVFINFYNGTDHIVNNAAVVEEAITQINAHKVPDDRAGYITQENVVMGFSMGGLCARYALASMTKNSLNTGTRLLITHDSPHKGANIPLGLQYMIRMMGGIKLFGLDVTDIYEDYQEAVDLLNEPATEDLLIYRSTGTNTFANNTFLSQTYRNMVTFGSGDPEPTYRFIATADGNECATALFEPGKTFINLGAGVSADIHARVLFFRIPIASYKLATEVAAYALPNPGSTNEIARVYTINNFKLFGFIDIVKELYDNTAYAPGNHLAIDGVPGSNYPLLDVDALNRLTNLPDFAINLSISFPLASVFGGFFGVYAYNDGVSYMFTFVPVASALDASPFTSNIFSEQYVNGINQNYPSNSENFIAQETTTDITNNLHIRFTARNSRWLYKEMEEEPNLENCSAECSNSYYIDGDDQFCTSAEYSVPGLPRGATISWTAGSNVTLSSSTSNPVILTKVSNGLLRLRATLTNACGGTVTISKFVTAGPTAPVIAGPYDPNSDAIVGTICTNQQYYFLIEVPVDQSASYVWTLYPPSGSEDLPSNYSGSPIYLNFEEGYNTLRLTKTVADCGTVYSERTFESQSCLSFRIATAPNPTTNQISVLISSETPALEELSPDGQTLVELINFPSGSKRKQWKISNSQKQFALNFSGVPKGLYVLKITRGNCSESTKIMIQ